jgi:hypothetical protein
MKAVALLLHSFVLTTALTACSGEDPSDSAGTVAPNGVPESNPFAGTPAYRAVVGRDGGQGLIAAEVRFTKTVISVVTRPHPTLPKVRATLASDLVHPQSVRAGITTQGAAFLIAVGVDFANNVSRIQTFVDINRDRLPDASSKTTVATTSSAHFVHTSFDRTLNRLYVLDALNRRVMVVLDNDGDGMPETLQASPFVPASLLPTGYYPWVVGARTPGSVRLWHYRGSRALDAPYHYVDCTDSNGDIIADVMTERSEDPMLPDESYASFDPPIYESDATAVVRARPGRTYRIEAETPTGVEELATFTATTSTTAVSLSRAAGQNESILLIEDASDKIIGGMTTVAIGTSIVSRLEVLDANGNIEIAKIVDEGNNVRLVGRNMHDGLSVELKPKHGTAWTACQEVRSSTTALEVRVPDLASATAEDAVPCEFRVLKNGVAIAWFSNLVME